MAGLPPLTPLYVYGLFNEPPITPLPLRPVLLQHLDDDRGGVADGAVQLGGVAGLELAEIFLGFGALFGLDLLSPSPSTRVRRPASRAEFICAVSLSTDTVSPGASLSPASAMMRIPGRTFLTSTNAAPPTAVSESWQESRGV